jgi:transcriptional regulator with XRE-family HTH domain
MNFWILSNQPISCYEKEAANLTFKTICKIATALNCSVVFLVDIKSGIYDEEKWKQQKCNEWRSVQL